MFDLEIAVTVYAISILLFKQITGGKMAPRFYSKEWCEAVKQKANSDEEYLKKTKGLTVKYMFIVTHCPDGNDIKVLWEYDKGKTRYEYTEKKAPSDMRIGQEPWNDSISLIKNQVAYDTFVKIQKGELTPIGALVNKLWALEGDLVKGMRFQPYNDAVNELQKSIPCEY